MSGLTCLAECCSELDVHVDWMYETQWKSWLHETHLISYANRVDWAYYHNLNNTCCDIDCESQPGF